MGFFQKIAVNALGFVILSWLLQPYFMVASIPTAVFASFLLALMNVTVKPLLHIFALPLTIITFGIFSFVINAIVLTIVSSLMGPQFSFSSFWAAFVVSILLTMIQQFAERLFYGK